MDNHVARSTAQRRLAALLIAGFGVTATLLAAVGVYGVLSYTVAKRTNEIGTRMALGARRADVVGLMVRQVLAMWLVGTILGVGVALAASSSLRSFVYEIEPADPGAILLAVLGIGLVSLAAAVVPALRAATTNCVDALRYE